MEWCLRHPHGASGRINNDDGGLPAVFPGRQCSLAGTPPSLFPPFTLPPQRNSWSHSSTFEHSFAHRASALSNVEYMFDNAAVDTANAVAPIGAAGNASALTGSTAGVASIAAWMNELGCLEADSDQECIDNIGALEALKSAAAAAQVRLSADFDSLRRREQAAMGVPKDEQGKGVAGEIALSRRVSPNQGTRHVRFSKALVHEMPLTLKALTAGKVSEWRATLLVRETACLTAENRAVVDHDISSDQDYLQGLSDRRLIAEARRASYQLDPRSVVERAAKAYNERNVTCRPAPDTMTYLTALLPASQGVAVLAALTRAADGARCDGDERGRGQVMADTLVERATGQAQAEATGVDVQLVMTDRALLTDDTEPAFLPGYGIIPAESAREIARLGTTEAETWIRRLYTEPTSGQLIGMESKSRIFPKGMAHFIATRDQFCSTPWCDAPIRHTDHVLPRSAGGRTNESNGRGLCEACNYAKEAPGWAVRPIPEPPPDTGSPPIETGKRYTTKTTTPTGHVYWATAPRLPGTPPAEA